MIRHFMIARLRAKLEPTLVFGPVNDTASTFVVDVLPTVVYAQILVGVAELGYDKK